MLYTKFGDDKGSTALVQKAMYVADRLQDWIDENSSSVTPSVSVTVRRFMIHVKVGNLCVWNTEDYTEAELTFQKLQSYYREEIEALSVFLADRPEEDA